jgi:hypothetical protein
MKRAECIQKQKSLFLRNELKKWIMVDATNHHHLASPSSPSVVVATTTISSHQMNRHPFDRATLAANTDLVRLLFGVPGTCWGSFACSHARIPGRMYAITTSVLFYSNVLGLERRFCLNFTDIVAIALHRTTSLRFELANDEVYIFRSFPDRHLVLKLLSGLRRLSTKDALDNNYNSNANGNAVLLLVSPPPQQLRPRAETNRTDRTVSLIDDADHQFGQGLEDYSSSFISDANSPSLRASSPPSDKKNDHLVQPPPSSVRFLNRQRANSDSVVRRLLGFEQDTSLSGPVPDREEDTSSLMMARTRHDEEDHRPLLLRHAMSDPLVLDNNNTNGTNELDPQTAWELEKAKAFTYENTGVEVRC